MGKGDKRRPCFISLKELEANENLWRGIRYTKIEGRVKIIIEIGEFCRVVRVTFNNRVIGETFIVDKKYLSLTSWVNEI
jgi:hypothetical protein